MATSITPKEIAQRYGEETSYPIGQVTYNRQNHVNPYSGIYGDMYATNPYTQQIRKKTFWDNVKEYFGMRSGYQAATEEREQKMLEYDAQIAQLKAENEYNSASGQAERMLQAGINPNMDPSMMSPGEGSGFDQTMGSPDVNQNGDQGFGDFMLKAISTAVSMYTGLKSAGLVGLQKTGQEIANNDAMLDLAEKNFNRVLGQGYKFSKDADGNAHIYNIDGEEVAFGEVLNAAANAGIVKFRSAKLRRQYGGMLGALSRGLEAQLKQTNLEGDVYESETRRNRAKNDPQRKVDGNGVAIVAKHMMELENATEEAQLKFDKKEAEWDTKYLETADPEAKAGAENSENELRKIQAEHDKAVQEQYQKMITELNQEALAGDDFSRVLLIILGAAKSFMPNVNKINLRSRKGPKNANKPMKK